MAADKTVTFGIKVQAESNADAAANTVEHLRDRIKESQEAVKSYSATLRQLRGTTDEVKGAKEKLKGAIEAEKNAVSANALALGKLGTTYAQVVKEQQKAVATTETMKEKTRALRDALKVGGDETRRLAAAFDFMDRFAANSTTAIIGLSAAGVLLAGAFAIGVVGAIGAAGIALAKFTLESGDLLRTQELQREATMGNAENAKAFGTQIEFLLTRIPATREELQKLSVEQFRLYDSTKISGDGIVDAFNAVGVASAAMGKEVGGRISDIIARGKTVGRFGLDSFGLAGAGGYGVKDELQGTGIKSVDVAKKLATNLHISLGAAERALAWHRVKLDDGAKAIREVIEERFAAINARRLIALDVAVKKLHDSLVGLLRDVNIEPFLERIDQLARNFDVAYVNGQAMKTLLEGFVELIFGPSSKKGTDIFQEVIDQAILAALKFELELYKGKSMLAEWVDEAKHIYTYFEQIAALAKLVTSAAYFDVKGVKEAYAEDQALVDKFRRFEEAKQERKDKAAAETEATGDYGKFKPKPYTGPGADAIDAAGFGSGSRLYTPTGNGDEVGVPVVSRAPAHAAGGRIKRPAFGEMFASVAPDEFIVPAPQAKLGFSVGGGGGSTISDARVDVTLSFPNVRDGAGVIAALSTPDALASVTKVFEDMVRGSGGLTQTPALVGGV